MDEMCSSKDLVVGSIQVDPVKFDPAAPTKWTLTIGEDMSIDPEKQSPIVKATKVFVDGLGTEGKPTKLTNALREKQSWPSAMSKIDGATTNIGTIPLFADGQFVSSPGSEPWLCVMRTHAWRYGPNHVPLPGCATVVTSTSSDTELYLVLLPMADLLKKGIFAGDLKAYLDTDSGSSASVVGSSHIFHGDGW